MTRVDIGSRWVSGATGGRPIDGDDDLIVLLHGAGMDRTVWALQTRWLAHRVLPTLAVDLPGHGGSPEDPLSGITDYADWLVDLVGDTGRRIHLAGHSMGSFIALEACAQTEIASVTLVGTAAAMPVHDALVDAAGNNVAHAAQLMSGWAFGHESRTGAHPSPGASMVGGTQALIGQSRPGVLQQDLLACASYERAVDTAGSLTTPVTFVLGALDRMTPPRGAQALIDACAASTVVMVPNAGHMLQVEAPRETREAIAAAATAAATIASAETA